MEQEPLRDWRPPNAPGAAGAEHPLAELILAGDRDALAGFLDARETRVRSFCAEVCPEEQVQEACERARVDFIGRLRTSRSRDVNLLDLDELLLKATRSAAAGQFRLEEPTLIDEAWQRKWTERPTDDSTCQAMLELLAGESNGELTGAGTQLRRHVQRCPTCQETVARMARAERAFVNASELPVPPPGITPNRALEALDAVREEPPTRDG